MNSTIMLLDSQPIFDLKQPPDTALAQPRIRQQWVPDEFHVE